MATISRFEDLTVWQRARELNQVVNKYIITKDQITDALKNQIDQSAGSVMDNIAEEFGSEGNKEFRQFLAISKGSFDEVKSQIYRACDENILQKANLNV